MTVEMTMPNLVNFFGIATGLGVCFLFLLMLADPRLQKEVKRYFRLFFSSVSAYLLLHLTRMMMDGISGTAIRYILYSVTFLEFAVSGFMTFLLSVLVLYTAKGDAKLSKKIFVSFIAITGIHIALLFSCYNNGGRNYYRLDGFIIFREMNDCFGAHTFFEQGQKGCRIVPEKAARCCAEEGCVAGIIRIINTDICGG